MTDPVEPAILVVDDDAELGEWIVAMACVDRRATWVANLDDALCGVRDSARFRGAPAIWTWTSTTASSSSSAAFEHSIVLPPIVIFCSQPETELRNAAQTVGASGILRKPCSSLRITVVFERVSR